MVQNPTIDSHETTLDNNQPNKIEQLKAQGFR